MTMTPDEWLRFVLDPVRLAAAGLVATRPHAVDEVVAATSAPRREVLEALGTMVANGLATHDGGRFVLSEEGLRAVARQLPPPPPAAERLGYGMTAEEREVIGRFFSGERLLRLPVQASKRRVVLERLALEFEPGRRYAEREVNDVLRVFDDDYTTLRRALVDEGLLDRAAGEYWRSGGRVVLADGSLA